MGNWVLGLIIINKIQVKHPLFHKIKSLPTIIYNYTI